MKQFMRTSLLRERKQCNVPHTFTQTNMLSPNEFCSPKSLYGRQNTENGKGFAEKELKLILNQCTMYKCGLTNRII